MVVTVGGYSVQTMPLSEKGALEDLSTASTIPFSDSDEDQQEEGEIHPLAYVDETGEIQDVDKAEDGEILQPVEPFLNRGLSQLELDELCVTESDLEQKSSVEEGELTDDDFALEISFEEQLKDSYVPGNGLTMTENDKSKYYLLDGEVTDDNRKAEICSEPQSEDPCNPHKGATLTETDKSKLDLLGTWCRNRHQKLFEKQFPDRAPRLAPPTPCRDTCRDREKLEPFSPSPSPRQYLHQAAPSSLPRQTPLLRSTRCSESALPRSAFDTAAQEQLSTAFSQLLSSDNEAVESAAVDFVMKLADALGPQVNLYSKLQSRLGTLEFDARKIDEQESRMGFSARLEVLSDAIESDRRQILQQAPSAEDSAHLKSLLDTIESDQQHVIEQGLSFRACYREELAQELELSSGRALGKRRGE